MIPTPKIMVNDQIELLVPTRRSLAAGYYLATVTEILPLAHRPGAKQRYRLKLATRKDLIIVSIARDPRLQGYLFLGHDRQPTPYKWLPNLETRLALSLAAKGVTTGGK